MAMQPIDGDKLKAAVLATGNTLTEASQKIDKGASYLSNCINRGKIDKTAARVMENAINVPLKLYEAPEPVAQRSTPEDVLDGQLSIGITPAVLYEIRDELKAIRRALDIVIDYQDDAAQQGDDRPF